MTWTGRAERVVVPLPSSPTALRPQQSTPPAVVNAHECVYPIDTVATAGTAAGTAAHAEPAGEANEDSPHTSPIAHTATATTKRFISSPSILRHSPSGRSTLVMMSGWH
jgi:hypothetical protein